MDRNAMPGGGAPMGGYGAGNPLEKLRPLIEFMASQPPNQQLDAMVLPMIMQMMSPEYQQQSTWGQEDRDYELERRKMERAQFYKDMADREWDEMTGTYTPQGQQIIQKAWDELGIDIAEQPAVPGWEQKSLYGDPQNPGAESVMGELEGWLGTLAKSRTPEGIERFGQAQDIYGMRENPDVMRALGQDPTFMEKMEHTSDYINPFSERRRGRGESWKPALGHALGAATGLGGLGIGYAALKRFFDTEGMKLGRDYSGYGAQ